MSTRILDLDLAEPLPADIDTEKCDRLLIILWSRGIPIGVRSIRTDADRIDRLQLAAALGRALGEKASEGAAKRPRRRRPKISISRPPWSAPAAARPP
ncbi:MAG: hypothetical protein WDA20_01655 [Desulfuromonadales bacterium]